MNDIVFSGNQVTKAGELFLNEDILNNDEMFLHAMDVLSFWRYSHNQSLENAFSKLQVIVLNKDKKSIFAKRLKRYISIIDKLKRFKSMKLKNMQDIGGCRAILTNEKKLRQVVRELKKQPEFRHKGKKLYKIKDYIKSPKEDGYRGYHIIGRFNDKKNVEKKIEIQLRTYIQHYWATALEIIDLFTGQALKSNQGEYKWTYFFSHVSEQFSIMDSIHMFNTYTINEKFHMYKKIALTNENITSIKLIKKYYKELKIHDKLTAFASSIKIIDTRLHEAEDEAIDEFVGGYVLLDINISSSTVNSKLFRQRENELAEKEYIALEKKSIESGNIVALVSTVAVGDIQEVYPNFFADSTMFLKHLDLIINSK